MKLLITGGAGYIGSHVAKHLIQHGHEVVVLDNLSRGHDWAARFGPLEQADLRDFAATKAVLQRQRVEAVLHFAAYALVGESVHRPELYYQNNTAGSLNLLQAMQEVGVERLIFSSTCATYGNPQVLPMTERHPQHPVNPYGISKLMVEQMLEDFRRAYGLQACSLRYFNACGCDPDGELGEVHDPETHLIPCIFNAISSDSPVQIYGDDYDTPDGTCVRDYIHVEDLASAHRLALERLPNTQPAYNLGNGSGFSVRQVIASVERVTGRRLETKISARRPGDPPTLVADASLARTDLGWNPRWTELDAIVESAWRWHCSRNQT